MSAPVPIFVITCDRLTVLQRALASYRRELGDAIQLVVHDNGSSYPPMLEYLTRLEGEGVAIFRTGQRIQDVSGLDRVAETISAWRGRAGAFEHYVVTDPDIELVGPCPDLLDLYTHLLSTFDVPVVGPMLRIDDLPDAYPLKERVIASHREQFWDRVPSRTEWRGRTVLYQEAGIDTSFGMYRGDFEFHRLNLGLRTHAPYWARHLDWYLDPDHLSPDQLYYLDHAGSAAHWGGGWLRDRIRPAAGRPGRLVERLRDWRRPRAGG